MRILIGSVAIGLASSVVGCGLFNRGSNPMVNTAIFSTQLKTSSSSLIEQANPFFGLVKQIVPDRIHYLGTALTLKNISGMADSLLGLTTEDYCGFSAWSANSQDGAVAKAGRTYEEFDLANPKSWTSKGTGLRSGCSGGTFIGAEAYFAYVDLTFTVNSADVVVRIAMGETGSYKAGDVLLKSSGVFNWIDSSGTTLTPETSTRPSSPHQYDALESFVPFKDGGASDYTVLKSLSMSVDAVTKTKSVSSATTKAVFDVNLASHGITATDTSTSTMLAKTLSIPFLDDDTVSPLTVTITPLTEAEKKGSSDPLPTVSNGE